MIILKNLQEVRVGPAQLGISINKFRQKQIANKIEKILKDKYSIICDVEVKENEK